MGKITIKDIARQAGVSIATVSYILNDVNTQKYSDKTKKKVLQIVNLYDYRPSKLAQAFVTSKSHNLIVTLDKHESVFVKSEYLDFIRKFSAALEEIRYNLLIKSHLEATRIDTADAIVCFGTEEETFLKLAKENYVPLLTVDARIHDELFFQVSQDFAAVMRRAVDRFGAGNFSVVLVDTYNEALKAEIRETCGADTVFLNENTLAGIPKGNLVTVNKVLTELPDLSDREILLCPALTGARIAAVVDCFQKASSKSEGETHFVKV